MQQGPEADKRREERRLNKEQKLERAKKREAKGVRGEKKERKQKKTKKTKLAGQPKRPMSSYFLWMNANRENIKKDLGPGASIGEIGKKSGELWKALSDKSVSTYSHHSNKANYHVFISTKKRTKYFLLFFRGNENIVIFKLKNLLIRKIASFWFST